MIRKFMFLPGLMFIYLIMAPMALVVIAAHIWATMEGHFRHLGDD